MHHDDVFTLVEIECTFKNRCFVNGSWEAVDKKVVIGSEVCTHCVTPEGHREEKWLKCACIKCLRERGLSIPFPACGKPTKTSARLDIHNLSRWICSTQVCFKERNLRPF